MGLSCAFHGAANSISFRKNSARVFFLLPPYSVSAKVISLIAPAALFNSMTQG